MRPPPQLRCRCGLLFSVFLVLAMLRSGAASALATFAMAKADETTIVCGLLPSASSQELVDLNCTAAGGDHQRQVSYPSTHPFSAVAGGEDFLCAVGPSSARADAVDMRWWDLSKNAGKPKRVYLGPPLRALDSSGYRVCGVLASGELHCWRWPGIAIPAELRFVAVAVGKGFVCGIVAGPPATPIRCFGNETENLEAVRAAPRGGSYDVVAACGRRACALSTGGALSCWGSGAPALNGENATDGYAALALGKTGVCGLRTNGTIQCFGDGVAAPPDDLAGLQYIDVQAQGEAFCGVLMANYSLVCWGGHEFNATNRLVFDRVLPGPCVLMSTCKCGVLPGSANLCAGGRCVCVDCAFQLNVAIPKAAALTPGNDSSSSRRRKIIIWAAVGAAAFLLLVVALQLALFLWCRRRRRRKDVPDDLGALQSLMPPRLGSSRSRGPGSVVEHFTLDTLRAATEGFDDQRRIGSGSFGSVYRGTLPDGREVAIKRAEEHATKSSSSAKPARRRDRETAFNSELIALARANHKNIVCLLGCCAQSGERVLVYEFMINGTLHDQLHDRSPMAPSVMSWRGRLSIALGAARGIEYMHVYAVPPIIHRDIKSANILLDDSWTAKIADFGLSSVLEPAGDCDDNNGDNPQPQQQQPQQTIYTGGTVGYMDPEYYRLQHLTDKSDLYSFGVVLLELMSGCRVVQRYAESVTPKNVVEFTVPHILADDVARVLDPRLPAPTPHEAEALAYVGYLAADCVGPVGCERPSMTEVVDALERALAATSPAPVSRSVTARRVLSRSGTDQFDLTDTD
ncbi:hypothetical protein ACQ4PT_017651 [Festuca glaucescens]